jgi:hypothetical protein
MLGDLRGGEKGVVWIGFDPVLTLVHRVALHNSNG